MKNESVVTTKFPEIMSIASVGCLLAGRHHWLAVCCTVPDP